MFFMVINTIFILRKDNSMFCNFNDTHFINLWKQNKDHNLLGKANKD